MPLTTHPTTAALIALVTPADGETFSSHTKDLHAMVEPLNDVLAHVHDRILAVQRAMRSAAMAETHEQHLAFFGTIRNACAAALSEATSMQNELDRLTKSCRELDDYAIKWRVSRDTYPQRVDGAPPSEHVG